MIYSQRDPRWANQRLGTRDGWTIGAYGCYTTSQAMTSDHFGHTTTPADLDNAFTDGGLYYNEQGVKGGEQAGLCWDGMLTAVNGEIIYDGTYHCETKACDLNQLLWANQYEHEAILEVDFDHDPSDGIQTHFVRFESYDPATGVLLIDDPWYGDEVNFRDRYGDPTSTIQKIVRYTGPSLPTPAPATPAPVAEPAPTPDTSTPEPVTQPVPAPSAPAPDVVPETPAPDISSQPAPAEPTLPDTQTSSAPPIVVKPSTLPPVMPSITATENQPIMKVDMSKYLSRKFLLTALGIAVAVGGYLSGALGAGESLTSVTFLIGLFNVVEGALDHKAI